MAFGESANLTDKIVSSKVRWFAVATGCFTAVAGAFSFGFGFAIVPSFLIVGALLQPYFPRVGRGLLCAGALWLSFWVFAIGIPLLLEHRSPDRPVVLGLTLTSVLLVAVCDLAIWIEELKMRRVPGTEKANIDASSV